MDIEINAAEGVERSEALDEHVRRKLARVQRRFGDHLTRVRVFLKDVNAAKGGIDKACTMEARLAGFEPVAVEAQDENVRQAVQDAAAKLDKAVGHRLGRVEARS